jgi:hypothetical protein
VRLMPDESALARRFGREHQRIADDIEQLRLAADALATHPTPGAMARVRQVHRVLVEEVGPGEPDEADLAELRSLLYGLHAILRMHTAREDESYLSLADGQEALTAAIK